MNKRKNRRQTLMTKDPTGGRYSIAIGPKLHDEQHAADKGAIVYGLFASYAQASHSRAMAVSSGSTVGPPQKRKPGGAAR